MAIGDCATAGAAPVIANKIRATPILPIFASGHGSRIGAFSNQYYT
jgi:hypothetical protein